MLIKAVLLVCIILAAGSCIAAGVAAVLVGDAFAAVCSAALITALVLGLRLARD